MPFNKSEFQYGLNTDNHQHEMKRKIGNSIFALANRPTLEAALLPKFQEKCNFS